MGFGNTNFSKSSLGDFNQEADLEITAYSSLGLHLLRARPDVFYFFIFSKINSPTSAQSKCSFVDPSKGERLGIGDNFLLCHQNDLICTMHIILWNEGEIKTLTILFLIP